MTNWVRITGLCGADRCGFLAFVVRTGADFCFRLVRLVGSCAILCSLEFCDRKEPQHHAKLSHWIPVNGLIMILRFNG